MSSFLSGLLWFMAGVISSAFANLISDLAGPYIKPHFRKFVQRIRDPQPETASNLPRTIYINRPVRKITRLERFNRRAEVFAREDRIVSILLRYFFSGVFCFIAVGEAVAVILFLLNYITADNIGVPFGLGIAALWCIGMAWGIWLFVSI